MVLHKHYFSPAMNGWGVFPNNKRGRIQKKRYLQNLFHQNKLDQQFFP